MAISLNPVKTKTSAKAATSAAKTAAAVSVQNAGLKASVKRELTDPMGIVLSLMTIVSRVKADALPVFQNEGIIKGIGAATKAVGAGIANYVSDVGFSIAFRQIGSFVGGAIGGLFGGAAGKAAGSNILGIAGNMIGGMLSNKFVNKIFPTKMYDNIGAQTAQNSQDTQSSQTSKASQYSDTFELSNTNSADSASYVPSSTTKTTSTNSTNPYNRPVAYVTSDGVTIYEKPDFSVHNYLTENGGIQRIGARGRLA